MTIAEFLEELQDLLQRDDPLSADDILKEMEEWDSMSVMACMVWFDARLDMQIPYIAIEKLESVQDLIDLSEGRIA